MVREVPKQVAPGVLATEIVGSRAVLTSTTTTTASLSNWDAAQSVDGLIHENVSNTDYTDKDELRMGYSAASPFKLSSLSGCWPLQEDSGGTAFDFSGNGFDADVKGTSQGSGGPLTTSSYDFAPNDTVETPGSWGGGSEISFSLWINWAGTTPGSFDPWVFQLYNGSIHGLRIDTVNGNGEWIARVKAGGSNYDAVSSSAANSSDWEHIVATYNGSELLIYVNGSQSGSNSNASGSVGSSGDMVMGNDGNGGNEYEGKIWDVRVYETALTASEVQTLYDVVAAQGTIETEKVTL